MRIIDAEALEHSIKSWYCDSERCNNYDGVMCRACHIDDALSEIDSAPTVDAEPVRHGRWVQHKGGYSDHYECTVCGKGIVLTAKFRYCPNCGAKMGGDENATD